MAKSAKTQLSNQPHPFALLFPPMTKVAFEGLKADIEAHGLSNSIITFEDKTLEGLHRERACVEAGVALRYEAFQGDANAALDFVVSSNLHRRHLTKSQRAMVASKLTTMRQGERTDLKPSAKLRKVSRKAAAASLDVSERSVDNASAVHKHGTPELAEAVESGVVPVSTAAALTRAPEEEQRAALEDVKRELDDKGKPSPAAKTQLRTAAKTAKASSSRKGKPVPKIKGNGKATDTGPSAEAFKVAVYAFAADIERHVIQSKWLTLIEHEKLPANRRKEVIRYLRTYIGKAQALRDKLEGYDHASPQELSVSAP